jgi:hypothetical protein
MSAGAVSHPSAPFAWKAFAGYLATFLILAAIIALAAGVVAGMKPLERFVASKDTALPPNVIVEWPKVRIASGKPVTWIPEAQRQELLERARHALVLDGNSLHARPLENLGRAMAESGWFHGQPVIRRDINNAVVIDGRWRVPAAVIRKDGKDQLISWEGLAMPVQLPAGQSRFPLIDGPAAAMPTCADGTVDHLAAWPGEDIAASLELLQVVLRQPWASQIAGIDASAFASEKSLVLTTTFGTRVVWGGRVSKPALGEVSSAQKLAHLSELFARHKRIDAGFPLIFVNNAKLQFDISATAKALASMEGQDAETPAGR